MLPHEAFWLIQHGLNRPHRSPGHLAPHRTYRKGTCQNMFFSVTHVVNDHGNTEIGRCRDTGSRLPGSCGSGFSLIFRLARQAVSGEDRRNSSGKLNPRNLSPLAMLYYQYASKWLLQ